MKMVLDFFLLGGDFSQLLVWRERQRDREKERERERDGEQRESNETQLKGHFDYFYHHLPCLR